MEAKQNDVLSGRGACFNYHPGNKKFRTILETYMVRNPPRTFAHI